MVATDLTVSVPASTGFGSVVHRSLGAISCDRPCRIWRSPRTRCKTSSTERCRLTPIGLSVVVGSVDHDSTYNFDPRIGRDVGLRAGMLIRIRIPAIGRTPVARQPNLPTCTDLPRGRGERRGRWTGGDLSPADRHHTGERGLAMAHIRRWHPARSRGDVDDEQRLLPGERYAVHR